MRTAAGLIMLIGGLLLGIPLVVIPFLIDFTEGNPWGILAIPWVGIIIAGGIFALQRKHWGLCLASSILTGGIIPIIFVALRKREWES